MSCNSETNHEGKIDYIEFVESYYDPAKSIGFNLAVLFTNLSEHMPNEPKWVARLRPTKYTSCLHMIVLKSYEIIINCFKIPLI